MVDNVAVTPGTGAAVSTDERVKNGVTVQVQETVPLGYTGWAPINLTVSTTAVLVVAARETRGYVQVYNPGATNIYLGPTNAVTAANGAWLKPGAGAKIETTTALYAIGDAGGGQLGGWEVWNS